MTLIVYRKDKLIKTFLKQSHNLLKETKYLEYNGYMLIGEVHIDNVIIRQYKRRHVNLKGKTIDGCETNHDFCEHGYPLFDTIRQELMGHLSNF